MRRLSPSTRADLMGLLAVIIALGAVVKAWQGAALMAVVVAINGVTVGLVALGYRMHTQDVTRFMLARGGLISGPAAAERDEVPAVLRRGH